MNLDKLNQAARAVLLNQSTDLTEAATVQSVIKALKLKGGKDADALINKMRDLGLESKVSKAHAEAATKILKGQIAKCVKNESTGLETQSTMKTLCDTFKEINFSFPIKIKDANGNTTYYEHSDGYWFKREYDANGNMTYFEDSNGKWSKYEHDAEGKMTYYEKSNGTWSKYDYDVDGNETYYEDSDGTKRGTPRSVKTCEGETL